MRATVVADVPSPHQNAFFDAVARLAEVDLEVIFCRRTMPGRSWSGEGPEVARHRFGSLAFPPDSLPIIVGYYLAPMLAAGILPGASSRRWIFWTDTLPPASEGDPLSRRAARGWFLRRASACISTGESGRAALLAHGVREERAFSLPFVIDQEKFRAGLRGRDETRAALGIAPDERVLLFVGQMIRRKGIDLLLEAAALVSPAPSLLLIGEGEDLPALRAQTGSLPAHFLGSVPHAELPRYFAAADAFVLPSRWDPWPVVVIEALAAGLPVIGTDGCGSVRDLIDSHNGFRCAPGDAASLAEAIRAAMSADLRGMAGKARESVAAITPEAAAKKFTRILEIVRR